MPGFVRVSPGLTLRPSLSARSHMIVLHGDLLPGVAGADAPAFVERDGDPSLECSPPCMCRRG